MLISESIVLNFLYELDNLGPVSAQRSFISYASWKEWSVSIVVWHSVQMKMIARKRHTYSVTRVRTSG